MNLKGKVAIVTGGNSGIGLAIVLGLAEQGANIVIDYVVHPEATEATEKQVRELGDQAIGVQADVSQVADLQRLIATAVEGFGRGRHHAKQSWAVRRAAPREFAVLVSERFTSRQSRPWNACLIPRS